MSLTGKCAECGDALALEAQRQIVTREGPYYDRWISGITEAMNRRKLQSERAKQ